MTVTLAIHQVGYLKSDKYREGERDASILVGSKSRGRWVQVDEEQRAYIRVWARWYSIPEEAKWIDYNFWTWRSWGAVYHVYRQKDRYHLLRILFLQSKSKSRLSRQQRETKPYMNSSIMWRSILRRGVNRPPQMMQRRGRTREGFIQELGTLTGSLKTTIKRHNARAAYAGLAANYANR